MWPTVVRLPEREEQGGDKGSVLVWRGWTWGSQGHTEGVSLYSCDSWPWHRENPCS